MHIPVLIDFYINFVLFWELEENGSIHATKIRKVLSTMSSWPIYEYQEIVEYYSELGKIYKKIFLYVHWVINVFGLYYRLNT